MGGEGGAPGPASSVYPSDGKIKDLATYKQK